MFEKLFKRASASVAVAEPDLPPKFTGELDHKMFLREEILRLDSELAEANQKILAFRHETTRFVNGRQMLIVKSGDPGVGRQQLEARWKELSTQRERILQAREKLLAEHARI